LVLFIKYFIIFAQFNILFSLITLLHIMSNFVFVLIDNGKKIKSH